MSQPDPVSKIASPTFAMILDVHIAMNATLPKGPHRDGATLDELIEEGGIEEEMSALKFVSAASCAQTNTRRAP